MDKKEKLTYIVEEPTESESRVQKIKKQLKQCQKEKEEYLSQAQRARADLINFRQRQERALEELGKYGQFNFIRELLPVLDSLRIGAEKDEGLKQIKDQLENILRNHGLAEIKANGEKFNPELHEAVDQIEAGGESGIIIEEVQKGYFLGEKVLRPSKVMVAK